MNRKMSKQSAKQNLKGHWLWCALFMLIYSMVVAFIVSVVRALFYGGLLTQIARIDFNNEESIGFAIGIIPTVAIVSIVFNLLVGMFRIGVSITFLNLADGNHDSNMFKDIFHALTKGRFYANFISYFLMNIFIALWSMLLIIPGIVKSYSYAMTYYIVEDMVKKGETISTTEAITKSRELMNGHKFEFFVLDLSFIGWAILASIPLGLGWFWLAPYIQTTKANFYRRLLND